jgi:integrase
LAFSPVLPERNRVFRPVFQLHTLLKRRKKARVEDSDLVFHEDGHLIPRRVFHKLWAVAREAAKQLNVIPHDLRRSAVRQLERARVPRQVAMRLVGHKTESIYRRYAIVAETDVRAAGASLDALASEGSIVTKSLQSNRAPRKRTATTRRNIQ